MATGAPLRTYSKRKHQDNVAGIVKCRRVLDLGSEDDSRSFPSSELPSDLPSGLPSSDNAIFSDGNIPPSTPPSSPPVLAMSPTRNSPGTSTTQSIFQQDDPPKRKVKKVGKSLVQMQLNFGQSVQRRCRDCGMEYVPSVPEDATLHKKFHAQHTGGVVMDKEFLKKAEDSKALWRGSPGVFIMSLNGSQDSKAWLKKARVVFDLATTDLGAVDIPDQSLWGLSHTKSGARGDAVTNESEKHQESKYKLYLYMESGRCVGLCLAEHIEKAYKVMEPEEKKGEGELSISKRQQPRDNVSLVVSEEADDALIGISRIWTSRSARKKGVATALLDCVEDTFRHGVATARDMVAFSQPTEMGTRLARQWFGKKSGWHVYID